jgi:SAM-dependent MidA family methyltransferase
MTPLARELRHIIAVEGAIPFERYMALCLGHPRYGYYMTRDPFGQAGDFTTAPEISQMFGELIGLWVADVWQKMDSPPMFHLIELGPGRGTLMKDVLRALKVIKACRQAANIHLVETSPVLQRLQVEALKEHPASWHTSIETLPEGPKIILANEFFDALPLRQYVRVDGHWHERTVDIDTFGALVFTHAATSEPRLEKDAEEGAILEIAPEAVSIAATLSARLAAERGAMLILDYGYTSADIGDTVQALKAHQMIDTLATPGEADITAHVNFPVLKVAAERTGCAVHGAMAQGDFLEALGLNVRAAMLKMHATQGQSRAIDDAVLRYLDRSLTGMGMLFKVMAISDASLDTLLGFTN